MKNLDEINKYHETKRNLKNLMQILSIITIKDLCKILVSTEKFRYKIDEKKEEDKYLVNFYDKVRKNLNDPCKHLIIQSYIDALKSSHYVKIQLKNKTINPLNSKPIFESEQEEQEFERIKMILKQEAEQIKKKINEISDSE